MNSTFYFNRKFLVIITVSIFHSAILFAQESNPSTKPLTKEERFEKLSSKLVYPLIKGSKMTGVVPVDFITNSLSEQTNVKLVFDFTQSTANNAQGSNVNEGLEEVARILNLHIEAGVKKENLKGVVVFHSAAILSILDHEYYRKTFKNDNPNIDLLNKLMDKNIDLVVCGQSILLRELSPDDFIPNIQFALSAKTALSKYQNIGYILFEINDK